MFVYLYLVQLLRAISKLIDRQIKRLKIFRKSQCLAESWKFESPNSKVRHMWNSTVVFSGRPYAGSSIKLKSVDGIKLMVVARGVY